MRPVTMTTTDASGGEKSTSICPPDVYITPFNVTLDVDVTGAATYTVEYTNDDIWAAGYNAATGVWKAVTGLSAASADAEATLISPVRGIRMRQTAGGGSASLRVTQAGVS